MDGMMMATKGVGVNWYLVGLMWQVSGVILLAIAIYDIVVHFSGKSRSRRNTDDSSYD